MEQQYRQENIWLETVAVMVFFLSLEKDRDVVLSGTLQKWRPYVPSTVVGENINNFNIQRRTDLKFVPSDIKPSAGFNTKANPTEGGK